MWPSPAGDVNNTLLPIRAILPPELTTQVPDQPQLPLQLRNVGVQIHTVDALHLEEDMIGKHISGGTR